MAGLVMMRFSAIRSRFGKFLEMEIEVFVSKGAKKLALVGSKCVTYLLEKSVRHHHDSNHIPHMKCSTRTARP
jgi:hypothetical protein